LIGALRLATFWLALIASAPAAAQPLEAARIAWGFDRSDLAPHPAVRFGVLANGMRYALMRNAEPAGALSVRLHFDAGSNVEGERELGFMHLIEHMIFHGSENFPQGALPLMLAHQGLRRWPDFGAFTSHDETVYRLDLSRSDARARETALNLMREISSHLVFSRRSVTAANAEVSDEIAARDAVQDRLAAARDAFLMPGSALARGPVAGTRLSIRRAGPSALRRLYEAHYVPDRATLVVVGDFDPATAEAEIVARFSDWQGRAPPAQPPLAIQPGRGPETRLFVDRAAPTTVTIAAVKPLAEAADSTAPRDSQFLEHLGSEMLNRRLARFAAQPDAPFISAESAIYDHFSTARLARIEVVARDRDWRRALRGGAAELRRALAEGFSQAELDEQLAASRRALADAAAPRTSSALADAIVDAVGRGLVFTEPAGASATEAYLARLSLADLNAAFRAAWSPARLIFVSHDRRIPNAEAAVAAIWAESEDEELAD
jgi:zinc protease